jgi:hypothetical protein
VSSRDAPVAQFYDSVCDLAQAVVVRDQNDRRSALVRLLAEEGRDCQGGSTVEGRGGFVSQD